MLGLEEFRTEAELDQLLFDMNTMRLQVRMVMMVMMMMMMHGTPGTSHHRESAGVSTQGHNLQVTMIRIMIMMIVIIISAKSKMRLFTLTANERVKGTCTPGQLMQIWRSIGPASR